MGTWHTPTRHGVVEIAQCGASICGRTALAAIAPAPVFSLDARAVSR